MQPHQRNHDRKPPTKKPTEEERANRPIFFYYPDETLYGLFCQWKPSRFEVPVSTLAWLVTAHPAHRKLSSSTSNTTPILDLSAPNTKMEFSCAEQFMMFAKAFFFHDSTTLSQIMATSDPATQKKLGKQVANFDDYLWVHVCERIAFEGNWWKAACWPHFRDTLLGTGEKEICEASSKDRRWGIGYKEKHAERYRATWGANLLGKCLMRIRGRLRERMKEVEEGGRLDGDWELPGMEIWDEKEETATVEDWAED